MLTRFQFELACKAFIAKYSASVQDSPAIDALKGWSWNEHPSVPRFGFMSRIVSVFWRSKADDVPTEDDLEEYLPVGEDEASEAPVLDDRESLTAQQFVVYSSSFQVPAFYFTIHDSKGSPLSLSNLLRTSLFHPFAFEGTEPTSFGLTHPTSFPLLSQGDHPTLGTPCWYLHPCESTNSVNELMLELRQTEWSEEQRLVRWLEAWFMVVGSAINSQSFLSDNIA